MSKAYKRKRRLKAAGSLLLMFLTALIILPLAYLLRQVWKRPALTSAGFFGMSVNFDKYPEAIGALLNELGVEKVLIRFRLDQLHQLNDFRSWIATLDQEIIINLIQDPNLDNKELDEAFKIIFKGLENRVSSYQVGSTINRAKWGFYSVREYMKFYQRAYKVAKKFPSIELFGPSVIDFEYHYTAQALFNLFPSRFNGCSALLYVDRVKTPENRQFGFDLIGKIDLLYSLVQLSPKVDNRILITETNWPIKGSGKYAPTSDLECVDEEAFANYLVRYYLLALASGKVEAVYWHQLIAVGFGLIDPREGLRKRSAFYAFKTMYNELKEAQHLKFIRHSDYFELIYDERTVLWTNDTTLDLQQNADFLDRDGRLHTKAPLILSGSPIYILSKEAR